VEGILIGGDGDGMSWCDGDIVEGCESAIDTIAMVADLEYCFCRVLPSHFYMLPTSLPHHHHHGHHRCLQIRAVSTHRNDSHMHQSPHHSHRYSLAEPLRPSPNTPRPIAQAMAQVSRNLTPSSNQRQVSSCASSCHSAKLVAERMLARAYSCECCSK
jgi:hypothetical protein